MNLIYEDIILTSNNVAFKTNDLLYENSITNIDFSNFYYKQLIKINNINYIYYREDIQHTSALDRQITKRLIINDNLELIKDENYSLNLGVASHNFQLFNINNKIYGIGGQALGCTSYNENANTQNETYINYHNNDIKFISSAIYSINSLVGDKLYDPTHFCPYFANGLYLFKMNENLSDYIVENNKLPILSGIKLGRHDGHYGYADNVNIDNSQNGLTVYDSNTSLLFNNNNNKYYLFQRANIGTGYRYIQYSTSPNLLEWSDWNLLKLNPFKDYFTSNYYTNNFFKIKDVNTYIAILDYTNKMSSNYSDIDKNGKYELYYSNDCENWDFIGNIAPFKYYEDWMVYGEPLIINNKYYFFIRNNSQLNIYSMSKNRFSFITPKNTDDISSFIFKPVLILNNKILLNFRTFENGFLKIQLLDENKNVITNYSYEQFDTINNNMNEFEFVISWNNNTNIFIDNEIFIEVEGKNYEVYSINY
jgi:hypothetical protein